MERVALLARRVIASLRRSSLARRALRQKELAALISQPGTFGILSAYRPRPKSLNQEANRSLLMDIQGLGIRRVEPFKSAWEGAVEKSVLVRGIPARDLFDLGEKYDQDAVIYKGSDGVIGMYNRRRGVVTVALDPEDLGPAFDVPWDKRTPVSLRDVRHHLSSAAEAA